MAGTPIEAVKEALEKLEEAQKDLNKARAEIQDLKKKVESLETQLAEKADTTTLNSVQDIATTAQTTANTAQTTANTADATANKAVELATTAQTTANTADATANTAVGLANNAQSAVANSVKNIKFFTVEATIDTTIRTSDVIVVFPERVDAVALESIMNDGHDMHIGRIDRMNDTTFKVAFHRPREGRWIPSLRFTGIQVER